MIYMKNNMDYPVFATDQNQKYGDTVGKQYLSFGGDMNTSKHKQPYKSVLQ